MFDDVPRLADLGPVSGRSVLVRADLNVRLLRSVRGPMVVADDFRILAARRTIGWLADHGARVTVAGHLGRPRGRDPRLAMGPVRARLEQLVPGVTVLENLRFDPGEEANDPAFGAELVQGQDLYVNDAFGACHRAHASIVFPPTVLPSAAGHLLGHELDSLAEVVESPARPFVLVVGGAKVRDKLGTIRALAERADVLLVGGAMAFTFLAAQGRAVAESLVDESEVDECRELLRSGLEIELPIDLIASSGTAAGRAAAAPKGAETGTATGSAAGTAAGGAPRGSGEVRCFEGDLPAGWRAFDIGPKTRQRFRERIGRSGTVLWNGPMGVAEDARFASGTREVASAIAEAPGFTVVGGGDTVAVVRSLDLAARFDHVSSGGGAMLELIESGDLPGIAALREARPARGRRDRRDEEGP